MASVGGFEKVYEGFKGVYESDVKKRRFATNPVEGFKKV